jgi:hypothetical protein
MGDERFDVLHAISLARRPGSGVMKEYGGGRAIW